MIILNYYLALADMFYKTICQLYTTESQTDGIYIYISIYIQILAANL